MVRKSWLIYISLIAVVAVIIIIIIQTANFEHISEISHWQITGENNLTAQILWQKSIPCLKGSYDDANGIIAVSQQQVLLTCANALTGGSVIAFGQIDSEKQWQVSASNPLQVVTIDNGYLVVFRDSSLAQVDFEGKKLWERKFTSRSVRAVFPYKDLLYIPNGLYGIHFIHSLNTGEALDTVEIDNVIAAYDDFLVKNNNGILGIITAHTHQTVWQYEATQTFAYKDIDRVNNTLLIYINDRLIQAYDITNGQPEWTIESKFNSRPLVLDDHLFVYNESNVLEVYSLESGTLFGHLSLRTSGNLDSDIAISGYKDVIAIGYRNIHEVVVIKLNL